MYISLVNNISAYLCIILLDSPGSYEARIVFFPLYRWEKQGPEGWRDESKVTAKWGSPGTWIQVSWPLSCCSQEQVSDKKHAYLFSTLWKRCSFLLFQDNIPVKYFQTRALWNRRGRSIAFVFSASGTRGNWFRNETPSGINSWQIKR